jgi:prepilin-type processing-associated H-X9-DG protein
MTRQQRPRRGLTILEVLLLLLLGFLVVGLVILGLQASRERSRRLQCAEHLQKIGSAIHLFRDKGKPPFLPASRIADGYATWAVQIAPYLELGDPEHPLLKWDLQQPYDQQLQHVREAQVPFYYCPARRTPPQISVSGDGPPGGPHLPGALGDYASAAGNADPAHPWDGAEADGAIILGEVLKREGDRILSWRGRTDLEDLPRGQERTILIGEKHVQLGTFGQAEQGDGSLYNGGRPASFSRIGGTGHGLAQSPEDPFNKQFGSYHPGLCHFLFADNHVEPMATAVTPEVLGRLLNRFK